MTRIPTKLERAQLHALYAPAGKLRDEADKHLEIETEKRLKRQANKATKPAVEHETPFMSRIMNAYKDYATASTTWLARNNNGKIIKRFIEYMQYGLGVGTSDYIGFKSITVTPDMVGKPIAVFMAVEGKRYKNDKPDDNQAKFIKRIHEAGGIALVVNAEQEMEARLAIARAMPHV